MKIEKNKVVSLLYVLRTDSHEGETIESAEKDNAFEFIFGNGMMLPAFEENIKGLAKGDKFQFMLSAEEAYGEFEDESVVDIPKTAFEVDGKIEEGLLELDNIIPMQDENGNRFNGRVEEVSDDTVTIDFNHPLAGEELYFTGEVFDIREATAEELDHGHVHSHGHHHHHH